MEEARVKQISELALDVHVLRRAHELERAAPGVALPADVAEITKRAEERLQRRSALEVLTALFDYRRLSGVPFKI